MAYFVIKDLQVLNLTIFRFTYGSIEFQNDPLPWVFWHRYWSRKIDGWTVGPFKERKKIMRTLCKRAGVRYFRYHALRHFGASLLEQENVPIGSIQRILGHEHRSTTELYLHSIGDSEREAMDVLNARFESFSHTDSHIDKKGDMPESS